MRTCDACHGAFTATFQAALRKAFASTNAAPSGGVPDVACVPMHCVPVGDDHVQPKGKAYESFEPATGVYANSLVTSNAVYVPQFVHGEYGQRWDCAALERTKQLVAGTSWEVSYRSCRPVACSSTVAHMSESSFFAATCHDRCMPAYPTGDRSPGGSHQQPRWLTALPVMERKRGACRSNPSRRRRSCRRAVIARIVPAK